MQTHGNGEYLIQYEGVQNFTGWTQNFDLFFQVVIHWYEWWKRINHDLAKEVEIQCNLGLRSSYFLFWRTLKLKLFWKAWIILRLVKYYIFYCKSQPIKAYPLKTDSPLAVFPSCPLYRFVQLPAKTVLPLSQLCPQNFLPLLLLLPLLTPL